jgi:SAM-dependent methyltransferase
VGNTSALFKKYYFDRPGYLGGTTMFQEMCAAWLADASDILEIGSGPSNPMSDFIAGLGRTTGVDVSDELLGNRALSDAHVFDGVRLPFDDESFDGCVSNYVLEHVEDAESHFREVRRVLRPGGTYLFRTPNLYHYVAVASRLLPHIVHTGIANRLRALPADAHEPWPTFYRANTVSRVRRLATGSGLTVAQLVLVEKEPYYARSSRLLFYPLMAYERLVNSGTWAERFRANIFAALQRPR